MSEEPVTIPPGWVRLPAEHMPHPTYFPAAMAMGTTLLFWGFVTSSIILTVGIGLFVASLAGWIHEIRHERQQHSQPPPTLPPAP